MWFEVEILLKKQVELFKIKCKNKIMKQIHYIFLQLTMPMTSFLHSLFGGASNTLIVSIVER